MSSFYFVDYHYFVCLFSFIFMDWLQYSTRILFKKINYLTIIY
ncbi:hypothetical protein CLOHYLEM_05281 [[Clostridium] hylemonae DSM 15053]|uniref:Uncharacterized protein n=1 Tax=[Clostridium] hylemonae DSM 15053 TaxID=553973 RepID=C0BZN9_9FIRM|nr:hypothetical protein CLOHYLEM_05281 [[Clostridium] hylemonae DSM 15053]